LIDERFQYLIKAVYTVISQSNNIDTTKYEDIARELLGNEAYLLFQVDRLVNQCTKHISLLQSDSSYKISKKLYV
jgi:histone deacetylase complex regulatory component SIN3